MKKKKLLKKIESLEKSFEALITVIEVADRQQTAKIVESEKSLQGQITRLWAHVQSESNSSHDELKKQIANIWRKLSELN